MAAALDGFSAYRTGHAGCQAAGQRRNGAGNQRMVSRQHGRVLADRATGQRVDAGAVHISAGAAGNAVHVDRSADADGAGAHHRGEGRNLLDGCRLHGNPTPQGGAQCGPGQGGGGDFRDVHQAWSGRESRRIHQHTVAIAQAVDLGGTAADAGRGVAGDHVDQHAAGHANAARAQGGGTGQRLDAGVAVGRDSHAVPGLDVGTVGVGVGRFHQS